MKKNLVNEYDMLESVIVHRPGPEHSQTKPENLDPEDKENYLLFDDLLYAEKASLEHANFVSAIKTAGVKNCFQLQDLLEDVLSDEVVKNDLLSDMANFYDDPSRIKSGYETYSAKTLPSSLIAGFYNSRTPAPLPNIMFTRDLGISIKNSMIITWASNKVRNPENVIAKYIIKNHKLFSDCNIYDFHENHPDLALEGGDVTLINEEVVAIGISERTSKASAEAITPFLYENGIKYIMCFNMPEERRFMHLDTVFSIINTNEAIVYAPFFSNIGNQKFSYKDYSKGYFQELDVDIITTSKSGPLSTETLKVSNAFKTLGIDFNFITCGGTTRFEQEREQWTDGANAFCISPGVIILYDRNPNTIEELEKHGYKKISADDFSFHDFDRNQKTAITIESGELSRGRGGPRCMTMPINRIK